MANRIESYTLSTRTERQDESTWLDTSQWTQKLETTIGEQPIIALGVAFSLGLVLGWLVKR